MCRVNAFSMGRRPRLVYQQRAVPLIGTDEGQLATLEVRIQSERVQRLTKTYVVLWNKGGVIQESDLDGSDPLRFEVDDDGKIIAANVVKATSEDNAIRVDLPANAERSAPIRISTLGPGEGAVFEILHTASQPFVLVRGAVNNMPAGAENRGRIQHPFNPLPEQVPVSFKTIGNTAFVLTFGIGALFVLFSAFSTQLAQLFGPHVAPVMGFIEGASDVIYAGLALLIIAQMRRRFPEKLAIRQLVD
jgi:hypothetical protein